MNKFPKSILLAVIGLVVALIYLYEVNKPDTITPLVQKPATSPYAHTIAAIGIVEGAEGNTVLMPAHPGWVRHVWVKAGDYVNAGGLLYSLDSTEQRAAVASEAALLKAKQEAYLQLKSTEQPAPNTHAVAAAQAEVDAQSARLQQAQAILSETRVTAPTTGQVLAVNIHPGELIGPTTTQPPVLFANTRSLQVRVSVDEINASLVQAHMTAEAVLKGDTSRHFPLTFVRIEPVMVPKKNLSGNDTERIDARVLQLIYQFHSPSLPVYVGQQVDVFLKKQSQ